MAKTMGVSCDGWKTTKFRERLIQEGFNVVTDKDLSSSGSVHIFVIEVEDAEFPKMVKKLSAVLKQLEIELKQSN